MISEKWQKVIFLAILLFSVITQESIFGRWNIFGVYLDLPLTILVLLIFLEFKFRDIFIIALAASLVLDVFSGLSFGLISFALLFTLWLADVLLMFLPHKNAFHFIPLIFLSVLAFNVTIFGLSELLHSANIVRDGLSIKMSDFLIGVGIGSLANSIIGIVLYISLKKWTTL